jgi:hypothetical protein
MILPREKPVNVTIYYNVLTSNTSKVIKDLSNRGSLSNITMRLISDRLCVLRSF